MVLDIEVYPKMSRKKSKAVSEGNGPVPQDACVVLGGTTLVKLRPIISETMDKAFDKHFEQKLNNPEEMKANDQRSAGPSTMLGSHVWPWR